MPLVGLIKIPPTSGQATRNDYTASVGYRFKTAREIVIGALGRFVGSSFANSHTLILWSDAGANLASCTITTGSSVTDGYAWETISNYTLAANTFYRISSNETSGGDVWIDAGFSSSILTGSHTLSADFDQAEFDAVHTGSQSTFPGNFHIANYAYGKMQMYESTAGGGGGGSSKNNLLVGSAC